MARNIAGEVEVSFIKGWGQSLEARPLTYRGQQLTYRDLPLQYSASTVLPDLARENERPYWDPIAGRPWLEVRATVVEDTHLGPTVREVAVELEVIANLPAGSRTDEDIGVWNRVASVIEGLAPDEPLASLVQGDGEQGDTWYAKPTTARFEYRLAA